MDSLIHLAIVFAIVFVFLPVLLIPYWRIFSRAGFSGWLSILIVVPIVNLIVLYYVAFARWNVKST